MSLRYSFVIQRSTVFACVCICDVDICTLLGCYVAFSGNSLPTFLDNKSYIHLMLLGRGVSTSDPFYTSKSDSGKQEYRGVS